jgi:hypothetical protein
MRTDMSWIGQDIEEAEARAAFVWILGEYGQAIQVNPYFHNNYSSDYTFPVRRLGESLLSQPSFHHVRLAVVGCSKSMSNTQFDGGYGAHEWR